MSIRNDASRNLPWGETTAYGQGLINELLRRYPPGEAPLTSVSLCRAWLLCNEAEDSDRSRKLSRIEIDANDQIWRLDGEIKGDAVDLSCWFFGDARTASKAKINRAYIRIWYANGVRDSRRAVWRAKDDSQSAASNPPAAESKGTGKRGERPTAVGTTQGKCNFHALKPRRVGGSNQELSGGRSAPSPLPRFGVKLCLSWLRALTLATHGKEDARLEHVHVHADDKHWSAPGTAGGDRKALVKWITGWSSEEDHEVIREHARKWRARTSAAERIGVLVNAETDRQPEGQANG